MDNDRLTSSFDKGGGRLVDQFPRSLLGALRNCSLPTRRHPALSEIEEKKISRVFVI